MKTFEVKLYPNGRPVYVDAETVDEAKQLAIGKFRKRNTAVDMWATLDKICSVEVTDKTGVQYEY